LYIFCCNTYFDYIRLLKYVSRIQFTTNQKIILNRLFFVIYEAFILIDHYYCDSFLIKEFLITLLKMFNMIDIGERAGSGIPNIFYVWREHG